jgi:hypothetical protein
MGAAKSPREQGPAAAACAAAAAAHDAGGHRGSGAGAGGRAALGAIYESDEFRIAAYKVLPCSQRSAHDW